MEVFGPHSLRSMSKDAQSMTNTLTMCLTRTNAKEIHPVGLRWGPNSAFSAHRSLLKHNITFWRRNCTIEKTGENLRRVCMLSEKIQTALDKNEEA